MEDPEQSKENLINQEIMQKGYQIEIFNVFLKAKKGIQGDDLSNWQYEDLENAIYEFQNNNTNLQKIQLLNLKD